MKTLIRYDKEDLKDLALFAFIAAFLILAFFLCGCSAIRNFGMGPGVVVRNVDTSEYHYKPESP